MNINKLINTAETNYYNKFKNASYQHYIRHPRPKEINPLCYLIIEKTSKITPLVDLISKNLDVAIFVEKLDNMPEFSTLKIYNKKVLNYEFLEVLTHNWV